MAVCGVLLQLCCLLEMLFLDFCNSCIKPAWYDVLWDVFLYRFTIFFSRVYKHIEGTSE